MLMSGVWTVLQTTHYPMEVSCVQMPNTATFNTRKPNCHISHRANPLPMATRQSDDLASRPVPSLSLTLGLASTPITVPTRSLCL